MSITTNKLRVGNFSSSEIFRLMANGKKEGSIGQPFYEYVAEKNMEIRLGRSLGSTDTGRAAIWGNLVERQAFELLGTSYTLSSQETIQHPKIEYWVGSPDGTNEVKDRAVIDIKCAKTLKSFCQLADCKTIEEVVENHKDGIKYKWQLVSNAILTGCDYAELICYAPYQRELSDIRELVSNMDGDQNKAAWINFASDSDLPYIIEGNHYKNINIIRFKVSEEDKKALTERVIEAGKLLIHPTKNTVTKFKTEVTVGNETMEAIAFVKSVPPIATEQQRVLARERLKAYLENNKLTRKFEASE